MNSRGSLEPLVEVNRSDHCLKCCRQYRVLVPAAGCLNAVSDFKHLSQAQPTGHSGQHLSSHQGRTGLGQLTLVRLGKLVVKLV